MRPHEQQILQYVAAHGPCSCKDIATGTGIDRNIVYRFLYKARCYGSGKGWIENKKPIPPDALDASEACFQAPGQYTITPAGLEQLPS